MTGLRAVYNDWSFSYSELLASVKMTTLDNRRLQDIGIFMFKVKNRLLSNKVIDIFTINRSNDNLK